MQQAPHGGQAGRPHHHPGAAVGDFDSSARAGGHPRVGSRGGRVFLFDQCLILTGSGRETRGRKSLAGGGGGARWLEAGWKRGGGYRRCGWRWGAAAAVVGRSGVWLQRREIARLHRSGRAPRRRGIWGGRATGGRGWSGSGWELGGEPGGAGPGGGVVWRRCEILRVGGGRVAGAGGGWWERWVRP